MNVLKLILNLLIALFLLVVVGVVVSGGQVFSLGENVSLSLRSTGTPGLLLALLVLVRLVVGGVLAFPRTSRGRFSPVRILLTWFAVSLAFFLYSRFLGIPLFWGGYFVFFLGGWLAAILLRWGGRTLVVRLSARRRLLFLALSAAAFFLIAYGEEPDAPHSRNDCGIWTRYDQSYYLRMASDLAGAGLPREAYAYGLGYPLLGAPLVHLVPVNPFFLPNLLLYVLAVCTFYLAGTRLLGGAGAILAVGLSLGPPFIEFFCIPWNNAVSVAAVGVLLHLGLGARCPPLLAGLVAGGVLGMVFASRYVDAALLFPLFLAALRAVSYTHLTLPTN